MRVVSALEVRKRFGQLIDEAAAGERLIIERAGHPVAAIVPLTDVPGLDRETRVRRRLEAVQAIQRLARRHPYRSKVPGAEIVRRQRDERTDRIMRSIDEPPAAPQE